MKNCNGPENQRSRRILIVAGIPALAAAFTIALPRPAHARRVTPPPVPTVIQVPAGNKAFFEGHAVGTQNYSCLPSSTGVAWTLFGPQATLFDDDVKQVMTHFLSPNPFDNAGAGMPRATWQHSRDTSTVWGLLVPGASSTDPHFVAPGAIPWLLLQVVGAQDGPAGGDKLTPTTYIQRLNTSGGVAPSTGCTLSTDVGKRALVPYTADYFFFRHLGTGADDDD